MYLNSNVCFLPRTELPFPVSSPLGNSRKFYYSINLNQYTRMNYLSHISAQVLHTLLLLFENS